MHKLILGSSSPFRKSLLEKLQLPFECMNPNIDESRQENEKPWDLVKRLALSKAQEIAKTVEKALIIGSDQVATFNEQVIGKPLTHEEAVKQLSLFSGQKVIFYTGLCLLNTENN